uniref:Sas10 C-terminal domain-containing protein n=1 Tax=Anopheles christyi TaxID=43041 RepID=A0A182JYB5_9DIPT
MPDKIKFGDVGSDYEPSASEDEFSEGEKELLKNVRERRRRNDYDEDDDMQQQAVLGFDDEAEDYDEEEDEPDFDEIRKFEHDSDIDDKDDEDDLPDRYAWGKKAGAYYGTGYKDRDYDTLTAQEEELARLEEEEAMEMQKRLIRGMTDEDFAIDDLLSDDEKEESTQDMKLAPGKPEKKGAAFSSEELIVIKGDLSDLSESQRLELFRKESPEFEGLVKECTTKLSECADVLEPVMELLKKHNKLSHPLGQLLLKRYELHMLYCSNISFYVLLKSQRVDIRKHPLVKRLLQLKRLVQEMEQKYEQTVKAQVEALLEAHTEGLEIAFDDEKENGESTPYRLRVLNTLERLDSRSEDDQEGDEEERSDAEQYSAKRTKLDADEEQHTDGEKEEEQMEDEEGFDVDGKRKITYQMAKNKGLSVRKRKDQRNIRVKNKMKYRKAMIRRKGAVRTVRTETKRYSGESSIKPYVKRGIKLK